MEFYFHPSLTLRALHVRLHSLRWLIFAMCLSALLMVKTISAAPVLIDFGPVDAVNGNATLSPDRFGNHWNNVSSELAFNLVDAEGNPSGIDLQFTTVFFMNGIHHGGLLEPNPELLESFAVATVTQDFFYADRGTISFRLMNLDSKQFYDLIFFGSRATEIENRITRYSVTGDGAQISTELSTTGFQLGADGYNGNNNKTVRIPRIVPNNAHEITVAVTADSGRYGYINAMSIQLSNIDEFPEDVVVIPEPSIAAWAVALLLLVGRTLQKKISQLI